MRTGPWVERLEIPALLHGGNIETGIVLGAVTVVGGGVLRRVARSRPRHPGEEDLRARGARRRV